MVVGAVTLALTSVAVFGVELHGAYLSLLRTVGSQVVVGYNNHSLVAFLTRFSGIAPRDAFNWGPHPVIPWVRWTGIAGIALASLTIGIGLFRIPVIREDRWRPLAEAAAIIMMLLVPPLSWTHYFIFVIPLVLALIAATEPTARRALAFPIAVIVLLCSRPLLMDHVAHGRFFSIEIIGGPTLALLLAIALVARKAWRREPS